ncbi:hypothetical protein TNCV_2348181 [Trichonephila clavipes]|uniref:Uncharacterized protein n=1 Tax=Trichonephila clavipes TaxID=2585209 RepID=A0A8X6T0J1_TRICX|nr:hypothetical protein TNCV_2348181 [Trichonephila clavipes]
MREDACMRTCQPDDIYSEKLKDFSKFAEVVGRNWSIKLFKLVTFTNKCHYLPHRPVIKLDSTTTEMRPVFDASARKKVKPSLND